MLDDYDQLKREFYRKFRATEAGLRSAEHADVEFPIHVAEDLYYGTVCAINADKELSNGHKKEAVEEMQKAVSRARQAFFDVLKLHILVYLRTVRDARRFYRGEEKLASKHIKNYDKHSENLDFVKNLIVHERLSSENPVEIYTILCLSKLRAFSYDYNKGKRNLTEAIENKKQGITKGAQESFLRKLGEKALTIAVNVAVATTVGAIVIFAVAFLFSCLFGEYLNRNPVFWEIIKVLKPWH